MARLGRPQLAGPLSNLIFAGVCFFVYGFTYEWLYTKNAGEIVLSLLYATAYINIALAIFNIIPIPPLDGSKILFSVIPNEQYMMLMRYEKYGMLLLIVIIYTGISGAYLSNAAGFVIDRMFVIAEWAFSIAAKII